jgi:hypothetical protein
MAFFADLRREYALDILISHHTRKNLEGAEFWEDSARGSSDFFAACDGLLGAGKRGKGLLELRGSLRAAPEPEPQGLALNEETLFWEPTSAPMAGRRIDGTRMITEIISAMPEQRWQQKLVHGQLMARYQLSEKQARTVLQQVPVVSPDEAPLGVKLIRWPIPGTKNEREVILR